MIPSDFKDDFPEIGQRFGHLYLGNDFGFTFLLIQFIPQAQRYHLLYVRKKRATQSSLLLNDKCQISFIFFGYGWAVRFWCLAGLTLFWMKECRPA